MKKNIVSEKWNIIDEIEINKIKTNQENIKNNLKNLTNKTDHLLNLTDYCLLCLDYHKNILILY